MSRAGRVEVAKLCPVCRVPLVVLEVGSGCECCGGLFTVGLLWGRMRRAEACPHGGVGPPAGGGGRLV